ncbi:MAG: hypothetical protein ABSB30_09665 [Terracidiphilus sp.]|jgi:hypothetical protein
MIRNIATRTMLPLLLLLSPLSFPQSIGPANDRGDALADALVKWKTTCYPVVCLMHTDVLRGESGDPPDPRDFREYISIDVALFKKTQKPAYFAFLVDPRVQRDQGIFIAFTKTAQDGNSRKINLDADGANRLVITDCNDMACTARVPLGLVEEGTDRHKMYLLDKFLNSDHLLVLYLQGGKAYRTMVILSSFKKEYQRIMTSELANPAGEKQ